MLFRSISESNANFLLYDCRNICNERRSISLEEPNTPKISEKRFKVTLRSGDDYGDGTSGRWSKEEHRKFLEGLEIYGKDWKKVQMHIKTRTTTQTRSHAQKFFAKTKKKTDNKDDSQPTEVSSPIDKEDRGKRKLICKNENPYVKNKIEERSIDTKTSFGFLYENNNIPENQIPCELPISLNEWEVEPTQPPVDDFEFDNIFPESVKPLDLKEDFSLGTNDVEDEIIVSFDFSNIF